MTTKGGGDSIGLIEAIAGLPIPLKKTGAAIDRLISVPFNVWADQLDAKMRSNVEKHVENVQKKRTKKGKKPTVEDASVRTAKSIAEWTASAADVDESDEQLSAIWRGLLDAILDDRDDPAELLQIVRSTTSSDLRQFLRQGQTPIGLLIMNNATVDRLKANGLVEAFMPRALFLLILVFSGTAVFLWTQMQARSLESLDRFPIQTIAFAASALLPIVFFWVSMRPSRQGKRLLRLYNEYRSDKE